MIRSTTLANLQMSGHYSLYHDSIIHYMKILAMYSKILHIYGTVHVPHYWYSSYIGIEFMKLKFPQHMTQLHFRYAWIH